MITLQAKRALQHDLQLDLQHQLAISGCSNFWLALCTWGLEHFRAIELNGRCSWMLPLLSLLSRIRSEPISSRFGTQRLRRIRDHLCGSQAAEHGRTWPNAAWNAAWVVSFLVSIFYNIFNACRILSRTEKLVTSCYR